MTCAVCRWRTSHHAYRVRLQHVADKDVVGKKRYIFLQLNYEYNCFFTLLYFGPWMLGSLKTQRF